MLNFAYDVPVKLFSLHLLSMAIFIVVPDAKRLLNIFLLNKATVPETSSPIYNDSKTKWDYMIGKRFIRGHNFENK